jgi:hypothetical protein
MPIRAPQVSHPKEHPDCEYCQASKRAIEGYSRLDGTRQSKFMKYARCFHAIEKWVEEKREAYENMDVKDSIEMERAIEGAILLHELKNFIISAKEISELNKKED